MSGLAFERALGRVNEAMSAGSLGVIDDEINAHDVDGPLVLAMHAGIPAAAVLEWAKDFSGQGMLAVGRGQSVPAVLIGMVTQALLLGVFTAEEVAKEHGS